MICNHCGQNVPDNVSFCPNCGAALKQSVQPQQPSQQQRPIPPQGQPGQSNSNPGFQPRIIKLKCKNCDATMEVDASKQEVVCPYCGAKELIIDSDAVAVEKIKSNTFKEMEYARMENQRQQQAHFEKEQERKAYTKGALSKFTIAFTFICLITVFASFSQGYILTGIIALAQTALFAISWLIGMQILTHNKKALYRALAILGFLLIIPFCASTLVNNNSNYGYSYSSTWPKSGLAQYLPTPPSKHIEIITDNANSFYADIAKVTSDDYRNYVKACEDKGFSIESDNSDMSYSAYNKDGYKVEIINYDGMNEMIISLDAPEKMAEFTWPTSDLAKLIPQPDSNIGKINYERSDSISIYVSQTNLDAYNSYVQKCMDSGFTSNYEKSDNSYHAYDANGNKLSLAYRGNEIMSIELYSSEYLKKHDYNSDSEMSDSETSNADTSDSTASDSASSDSAENTDNAASTNVDPNAVTPELKDFLDSYESFMDEYIAFMQKYDESDDTLSMLSDYSSMMSKYSDFAQKVDAYDTDEMSAADAAYYLEVINRVNQKLINASLS